MKMISFKLPVEAVRDIDRTAEVMHLTRSDYLRAVIMGGTQKQTEAPEISAERLSKIEAQQQEISAAFTALLDRLGELVRTPSFREYKSRRLAEEPVLKKGESTRDYLIRIAEDYFRLYGVWPDCGDLQHFGTVPDGGFPKDRPV